VWLLGVGWHESGSRGDAYTTLKARDLAGTLMPDEHDYVDLEMSLEDAGAFVVQVSEQAPALVAQARLAPAERCAGHRWPPGPRVLVQVVVVRTRRDARGDLGWFRDASFRWSLRAAASSRMDPGSACGHGPVEITIADLEFGGAFLARAAQGRTR